MHVLQKMKKLIPMQTRRACLAALLAGLLSACAPRLLQPAQEAQIPADFPGAYYTQAAAHGKKVLRVDAGKSLVVLEVRRAGAFGESTLHLAVFGQRGCGRRKAAATGARLGRWSENPGHGHARGSGWSNTASA